MKKTLALLAVSLVALAGNTFASGEVVTGSENTGTVVIQPAPISPTTDATKAAVLTCIKTAALTREGYLQSAYSTFSDAVMIAYLRRSEAITAAYAVKTMKEARPLIKTAFDTWKTTVKTARETLKKTRKDIWESFKNSVKACRPDKSTSKDATMDATWQEKSEWNAL